MPVSDLAINQIVTFTSKLPTDSNQYHGKVLAIMDWSEAIKQSDIVAYNTNMINTLGSGTYNTNYKDVTYILLEQLDYANNMPVEKIIFAKDWINEATFSIYGTYKKVTIVVYGVPEAEITDVTDTIQTLGYSNVVTKIE